MDIFLSIPFLIFMPLVVSMLLISPLFTRNEIVVRRFAKSVFGFHFLYAVLMLIFFDSANPYVSQIHFYGLDWIQSIGVKFIFKIDNISMILTLLTSFVFLLASFASKFNIRTNHKFYYSMLMLLMSAILGIFTAGDMFVFFLFWELELIPAYFLIGGGWKNETDDELKSTKFCNKVCVIYFPRKHGNAFRYTAFALLQFYFKRNIISRIFGHKCFIDS